MRSKYLKIWSREYSVQYCECALRATGPEVKKHLPSAIRAFMITENSNQCYYAPIADWNQYNKKLSEIFRSGQTLKKYIRDFHRYGKEYIVSSEKVGSLSFTNINNKKLLKIFHSYLKTLNIYTAYLWGGYSLNELAAENGKQLLVTKKIDKKKLDRILLALFSPTERTSILKLQDFLAKQKQRGSRLTDKQLEEILKNYAWMPCLDLQNDPWTKKELLDFYKGMEFSEQTTISFNQAAKLARLNPKEVSLFKMIRQLAFIKDLRDEYRRKGVYGILPFFDEIGRRLDLAREEVVQMTNREIASSLSGHKVNLKEVRLRKKGFVFFWSKNDLVISTKPKDLNFFKAKIKNTHESNEITGLSASGGKVKGRAKIVTLVSDLRKIAKGDILVAVTTHPDFVPAMQKAAAVVTDEGGLTSHAAIVAREMKKPCIVGTKIATKLLKDGDMIEVDANKGIVRKL